MKKKVCLIPVEEPSPAERAVEVTVKLRNTLDRWIEMFGEDSSSVKNARAEWHGAFQVIHAAGLDAEYISALVAAKH